MQLQRTNKGTFWKKIQSIFSKVTARTVRLKIVCEKPQSLMVDTVIVNAGQNVYKYFFEITGHYKHDMFQISVFEESMSRKNGGRYMEISELDPINKSDSQRLYVKVVVDYLMANL